MHRIPKATLACAALVLVQSTARAQSADDINIWSLLLEVHTCDVKNGGTDDGVALLLDGRTIELDRGRNERERNDVDTYELAPFLNGTTGRTFADRPVLSKRGTDLWCIDEVSLYVNGTSTPAFEWHGVQNIDQAPGRSQTFQLPSIRSGGSGATSRWASAGSLPGATLPPTFIDGTMLWHAADTVAGHFLRFEPNGGNILSWGDYDGTPYTEVSMATFNRLHISLKLDNALGGQGEDYTDFTVTCDTNGRYRVTPARNGANGSSLQIFQQIGIGIARMLDARTQMAGQCREVRVVAGGDILFM